MFAARQDPLFDHHPSQKAFPGVRFVLLGFDPLSEHKVRSKLISGGGIDVGRYSLDCTHVIVDKIVYDDPICKAARCDGKILVTGLWVDHSYDIGMPIDGSSILYRPLRDLNGIPGAKSIFVCLTGYQRQDRDDIMTMVGLMGAQFSKPLVANKVTHLICYKFEGEKYELAKKLKKIKLVNHRWLEDCLKAWQIVSEDDYSKSGYELEIMEAEAKDSEEEAGDIVVKQPTGGSLKGGLHGLKTDMPGVAELPVPIQNASTTEFPDVGNMKDNLLSTENTRTVNHASCMPTVNTKHPGLVDDLKTVGTVCAEQFELLDRSLVPNELRNDCSSTSGSVERHPQLGDSKFNSLSSSRNALRKSPLPALMDGTLNNLSSAPKASIVEDKAKEDGISSGFKHMQEIDIYNEGELSGLLPQKRKTDNSSSGSKSPKTQSDSKPCGLEIPSVSNMTEGSKAAPLLNVHHESSKSFSFGNSGVAMETDTPSVPKSPADSLAVKSSTFNDNLLASYLPVSKNMSLETEEDGHTGTKAPQTYLRKSKVSTLDEKAATEECATGQSSHPICKTANQENHHPYVEDPSFNMKSIGNENSLGRSNFDLQGDNSNSLSKPFKKETVVKKRLGSRAKLSTSSTAGKKGSIYLNSTSSPNNAAISKSGGEETVNREKFYGSDKIRSDPSPNDLGTVTEINSGKNQNLKTESMDEETEAPDVEDVFESERAIDEKSAPLHAEDVLMDEKQEDNVLMDEKKKMTPSMIKETELGEVGTNTETVASKEKKNCTEPVKAICDEKDAADLKVLNEDAVKRKKTKANRHPLGKAKTRTSTATTAPDSSKCIDGEDLKDEKNTKKMEMEGKTVSKPPKHKKETKMVNKLDGSIKVEKENKPVTNGAQSKGRSKKHVGEMIAKVSRTIKANHKAADINVQKVVLNEVKAEPVWFILSGHKLQRKQFQLVIRRLKGKFCRDSHHWSYQATHFVAPEPIRRTEKFFAAAASGRWILKTDYLAACGREGKFLSEEPYEWHKNGLSEDGAINLEAPRKWRLLRERTGHGALYGMRIIIYGECIAPPLDTLKRVVKAGGGTILATSPPYAKFLDSEVDFAIVSPGMPRVDLWVLEFLRHEIPCVVADYLVEYVCKPGYSLEKHVLYNSHAWAEKSFAKMQRQSEEIVEDSMSAVSSDLSCEVCGSSERGEVMLICGDESGSVGCGIGTHIDCCDPPLEAVPEDDWFCPNCSKSSSDR